MAYSVAPLERLIEQFASMQGIGRKTAQRMAFDIISMSDEDAKRFAQAITDAKLNTRYCKVCCNLTDGEVCAVCSNPMRSQKTICVVEDVRAVMAIEKTGDYTGTYHVLHGTISPMDGVGPDQLTVKELLARIGEGIEEVILATNPTVDGETTAMYISKLVKTFGIRTTRLAYGLPAGGDLEYADEVTLSRAIAGRSEM